MKKDVVKARKATLGAARRGEAILAEIEQRKGDAARAFYRIGSLLLEMEQKRLWLAMGADSLMQLLEARNLMSETQAKKLMEVTRRYSEKSALTLGPELAYAVARHVARTKAKDSVEEIVTRGFPVGGRRKPVSEISIREVRRATREAVSRQTGRHGESAQARRDADAALREARKALIAKGLHRPDVRLEFAGGQWVIVMRVPAGRLGAILGR